jgi:hypothetical protein
MIDGKTTQDVWFDNWMAKPPPIDWNSPYSVLVFFEVDDSGFKADDPHLLGGYHCGQFNYVDRKWSVVPSSPNGTIRDTFVTKWMHIPRGAAYREKELSK